MPKLYSYEVTNQVLSDSVEVVFRGPGLQGHEQCHVYVSAKDEAATICDMFEAVHKSASDLKG